MKKITLFLTALLISAMSFAAESLQATMDFTTNNWGFPEGSANKVTTEATYTNGVFTIKCNASVGHYFHTDGYFLFGKKEATFTFPAFDFKTTKIVVTGRSGASSKVTQNIFVGDQAVSTETTGAAGTNTYEIAEAYQAAGNVYVLTILQGESNSGYNSQITKIEIYGEAEVGSDATMYNVTATVNDEAMGSVSGTGEFAEGSTVVLTAEPKLGYEFVKWEDESTINPRQVTVNADVNVVATFQALPVKTIAEVNALADNSTFALNEFVVTYVNGKNTYIKDATGYAVICSDQAYGLNAGDVVAANKFMGTKVTKSGAVQYQPAVEATALAATAGTAPSPEVLATTPAKADLYKYVKLEQVVIQGVMAPVCLSSLGMLNMEWLSPLTTFTANGIYEVVGVVTSASGTLQVNMISEKKLSLTIATSVNDKNMGKVKGAGEYLPGTEATLTAEPKEGYEFANWTAGEEVVSTEEVYTFTVSADAAFVANFKEVVKAIEVNVTGATATASGQNIDINAQWNEQSMLIMLWQGGATQGFGTYAAEDYGPIMLGGGIKEWTPTTAGVYTDNGDGTFTFTCSATDGTTQYNITVTGNNPTQGGGEGDVEEPEYPVMEDAITNLVLDLNTMTCKGGPSSSFSIIVELYIGEPNVEGTLFNLTQESTISVMGNPATFVSGYIKDINTVAPSLTAVVVAQLSEFETYQFEIAMSAEEIEAMPIEVTNANITVEEFKPFPEAMPEYSLNMKATWTDAEGITYPVTVNVYTYDPNATEATESLCDVTIGDIINDPWLGGVDGCYLTITTENGVVTATGTISNINTGFAADFTISGTLPQGPSTGVENLNGTVAPVKVIENGQIFIIRNGVKYNAQGAQL